MKTISVDLPKSLNELIICPLYDMHIGEASCDMEMVQKEIDFIKNTPNAYAVIGGDVMDNTTKNSIGDVYSPKLTPQEQLVQVVELFKPIKDKILCMVSGNHEERTWKESGIDLLGCVAMTLGIENRYANEGAVVFAKFGNKKNDISKKDGYSPFLTTIYAVHGSGGGKRLGGKANRLYDLGDIVDCDIVICGHTHEPICFKKTFFRTDLSKQTIIEKERLYVNTGSFLKYAKYAEKGGYLPSARVMPKVLISKKGESLEKQAIM